jgi:hypothetical protein
MTPSVTEVAALFQSALGDDPPPPSGGVLGLLAELHRNNLDQWQREDATRAPGADDATIAAAKRDIDALNSTRHRLVEAIDKELAAMIEQDPSAIPTTESPAMVFDRLSVLTIRIHFTERAARPAGPDSERYRQRLPLLKRHLAVVEQALDGLFDDVRAGRKQFLPYQSLKIYGSAGRANESTPP